MVLKDELGAGTIPIALEKRIFDSVPGGFAAAVDEEGGLSSLRKALLSPPPSPPRAMPSSRALQVLSLFEKVTLLG